MNSFFKAHPYLRIYLIVLTYATLLFCWGKIFRDYEWYLDGFALWFSIAASVVGVALSGILLYFRYNKPKEV